MLLIMNTGRIANVNVQQLSKIANLGQASSTIGMVLTKLTIAIVTIRVPGRYKVITN